MSPVQDHSVELDATPEALDDRLLVRAMSDRVFDAATLAATRIEMQKSDDARDSIRYWAVDYGVPIECIQALRRSFRRWGMWRKDGPLRNVRTLARGCTTGVCTKMLTTEIVLEEARQHRRDESAARGPTA
ncbi:MAG TPA: hypothetical protein VF265_08110 [Nevskiaceae bacterium]